ncbi:hypothetical protein GCM10010844_07520 [Deinococcus radiotolerans]|uniref:Uncharacterized protein n=1 Tax=Deinococcus radiotolerans TaxID=1309407 RepID=A0ABQ2FIT9_9DEIO|nr:hypothetical protein GCM10010844_07520 [Deinococcus radiotolerans]
MTPNDSKSTPKKAEDALQTGAGSEFALSGSEQNPALRDGTAHRVPAEQDASRHDEHHREPLPGLHAQAIQTEADRDENHEQQQTSQPEIGHTAVSQALALGGTP